MTYSTIEKAKKREVSVALVLTNFGNGLCTETRTNASSCMHAQRTTTKWHELIDSSPTHKSVLHVHPQRGDGN